MLMWLFKKVFFLVLIVAGAYFLYQNYGSTILAKSSPQAKKFADNVLGTTTKMAGNQASKSASFLEMVAFKQASKPLIDQYKKLPKDKQEQLRKQICK